MQYIILDNEKRATHGFKGGVGAKRWEEVEEFANIGWIVPDPFIVLDFDSQTDSKIMLNIIETLDLKCRVMRTTRGIHVWFRSDEPWKCFKKTRNAIGLYPDCKSHSKNAYVKIRDNGVDRPWIRSTPADEIEEVPKWLYPVTAPLDKFKFKQLGDGDGRNQELFNYIVWLQAKSFKKEEITDTLNIVNQFVFKDSLSDFEMDTICRDEAFKPDDVIQAQIDKAEKKFTFSHNEFGDELIDTFHIITVNNQLYVYEDGYYQQDEKIIERKMIEILPTIKQTQRNEVLSYIKIKTHIGSADLKINPYIVNLVNTRLDLRTGEQLPFTPEAIEFDRINALYDQDAYCADLDNMLKRVFLKDKEVIALFEEMIGYCLIKHARYQKSFMLYGSGSNGKSTILNLIKKFIGSRNYSSIELDKLTEKFAVAELENKLANIGDDLNNTALKDTGTLKKLFSGNTIQVERKGERPFTLEPCATHIFSCNEIPRSFDKSQGFYRRWLFIPFNAKFSKNSKDYDPLIEDKITTDLALSYMLNLAIRGAQRIMQNGGFTEPESVKQALEDYQNENSTTLSWVSDVDLKKDYFLNKPTDELYSEFSDWCKRSGIQQKLVTGKKTFNKEVIQKFNFEDRPKQRGNGKRYFIVKI